MSLIISAGCVEERGRNSCRVKFTVTDTETGERRVVRRAFAVSSQSKAEHERCKAEFRESLRAKGPAALSDVTLAEYARAWLSDREADPDIAAGTVRKDRTRLKAVLGRLGDLELADVTPSVVKRFLRQLAEARTAAGKPLSGTYRRGIFSTLRALLNEAYREGLIAENPCGRVKAPGTDTAEKEALSSPEYARMAGLLLEGGPGPARVGIALCLMAGLRRGEACALTWDEVDLGARLLHVRHAVDARTLELKAPKSRAGARDVPIPRGLASYLSLWRREQRGARGRLGLPASPCRVVSEPGLGGMHPENLSRAFRRFCSRNGFEGVSLHSLRHSYCTQLVEHDVPLARVQKLMGHADPSLTMRVYAHHIDPERDRVAADAIDGLLPPSAGLAA